jgi:probable F420-dependent oxidoreductase
VRAEVIMKIGLLHPFSDNTANPALVAKKMEALGFESLWVPEHPILPANPKTQFPGGGPIPDIYYRMADQFVALAMAAGVTSRLKLATGICLVPEHNPLETAKLVATLDTFCGGRFMFGIGAGWLREESEILGVDFPHRWTQTAECVAAMRTLWSNDIASFEGKYVKFPPLHSLPKPAQKPGPPVLIGSVDKNAIKRVAKWGDGWCPVRITPDGFRAGVAELKRECEANRRDFSRMDLTAMGFIAGERAKIQDELSKFAEAGARRYVVGGGTLKPDRYEAELERLAKLFL